MIFFCKVIESLVVTLVAKSSSLLSVPQEIAISASMCIQVRLLLLSRWSLYWLWPALVTVGGFWILASSLPASFKSPSSFMPPVLVNGSSSHLPRSEWGIIWTPLSTSTPISNTKTHQLCFPPYLQLVPLSQCPPTLPLSGPPLSLACIIAVVCELILISVLPLLNSLGCSQWVF